MGAGWTLVGLCACGRLDFGAIGGAVDGTAHTGFAYRKPLVISHTSTTADLADFPLAVHVTDGDLRAISAGGKLATGEDFAFLAADGQTPLAFELDVPLTATGDLLAWVKIPLLSASVDTELYLAFGDPMVTTSQQAAAAVWSNGYIGVWHFSETAYAGNPDEARDSAGVHHGTAIGASSLPGGWLGRSASFVAMCDQIQIPASAALQPSSVTVSAWAQPTDIGISADRIGSIVSQDYWRAIGSGSQGYYLEIYRTTTQPTPTFYAADGPTFAHAYSPDNVANSTWFYATGTYDETTGTSSIYVDGLVKGTSSMTGPIAYLSKPLQIGCSAGAGWWAGAIDEVRISKVVRSPEWIATEHANQVDPSAFIMVMATEPTP